MENKGTVGVSIVVILSRAFSYSIMLQDSLSDRNFKRDQAIL